MRNICTNAVGEYLAISNGSGYKFLLIFFFTFFRYSVLESDPSKHCLFMITNGSDRSARIQFWHPGKGQLYKQVKYDESLSALAVRNDGRFIAVGTMTSGSVIIFAAFSLQVRNNAL